MNTLFVAIAFVCIEAQCAFVTPKQAVHWDKPSCERALATLVSNIANEQPTAVGSWMCLPINMVEI